MNGLETLEYHFIIPSTVLLEVMNVCEKHKIAPLFATLLQRLDELENVSFMAMDTAVVEAAFEIPSKYTLHDRVILASARIQKAALITRDRQLLQSNLVETVW